MVCDRGLRPVRRPRGPPRSVPLDARRGSLVSGLGTRSVLVRSLPVPLACPGACAQDAGDEVARADLAAVCAVCELFRKVTASGDAPPVTFASKIDCPPCGADSVPSAPPGPAHAAPTIRADREEGADRAPAKGA